MATDIGKSIPQGKPGCALSHVAVYRHMYENGIERAVIIEDDVALPKNFDAISEQIIKILEEGAMLRAELNSQARNHGRLTRLRAVIPYFWTSPLGQRIARRLHEAGNGNCRKTGCSTEPSVRMRH